MSDSTAAASDTAGLHLRRLGGATALMMSAVLASRVIGYLREMYVAWAFGAHRSTDAFVTAFTIPDWLNYLVAGGSLSITFIAILSPYVTQRKEAEGYRIFSIVATFMSLILLVGVGLAEVFAPQLLRWFVPGFTPAELASCVHMTRILLPAQLFFCVGGLMSAVLYTRGAFLLPALAPLFYNMSIIVGGLALSHWLGISSLAVGALAGAIIGPFLLPLCGAARSGLRYRFSLDFSHPEFRRWMRLTLPLMIGVSLVTADDWIMRHLAANLTGAISHLNYAKRLIGVPIAVLGQAVGQASMPFFSALIAQNRWPEFRDTLDRSVARTVAAALLLSSFLAALALPAVRLIYERGQFSDQDARETAAYLLLFALSLVFWSAQSLYSRAFYAAGDTLTPMVAGTLITAGMYPAYVALYARMGVVGLAIASDLGIAILTLALALLLRRRQWLAMSRQRWREMPGLLALAAAAGGVGFALARRLEPAHYRGLRELGLAALVAAAWLATALLLARLFRLRALLDDSARLLRRVSVKAGILQPRGEGGP